MRPVPSVLSVPRESSGLAYAGNPALPPASSFSLYWKQNGKARDFLNSGYIQYYTKKALHILTIYDKILK